MARAIWIATALLISYLHLFVHGTRIDHSELDLDESGTWGVARRSLGVVLTLPTEFHSQPPLYYLILHGIIQISSSTWVLRGFSWLCMLLVLQFILFYLDELNLLARVYLCLLIIFSGLSHYLATAVRPYGMAASCTLVSSVLLARTLRDPTRRRALAYAIWTWAMLNTMAFEIAAFMVQALVAGVVLVVDVGRIGWRDMVRRHRYLVIALVGVVLGYLPYLLMALHYQYHSNSTDTLRFVFSLATYEKAIQSHFQIAPPLMMGVLALCAVGLVGELRARNVTVLLWPWMAIGQIAFVWFFIVGRSQIGVQGKYMMPAFVAVAVLSSLGFQQLVPRARRSVWLVIPALLAYMVWPRWQEFHAYMRAAAPVGGFGILQLEMAKHPGKKVMFFDIGYDGQHLEHIIRDNPDVTTATNRGRGWSSGGDALTPKYILDTVGDTASATHCYFYFLENPNGPYATAFVPAMKRLGYEEVAPLPTTFGRRVPGFCRAPATPR